ncbi:MAG: alkaline phosphatase family protein [Promethearchaeia archaeon]
MADKYLIQFLVDHTSPDVFFDIVDRGLTPHLTKYVLGNKSESGTYKKASISRHLVTGYPSTSANSHTSLLTGCWAGKNDMLHTQYWDFREKTPEFVNVEEMSISALRAMNKDRIYPECKTLFEHTNKSASFHAINRGADVKLLKLTTILFRFLPLLWKIKRKSHTDQSPINSPQFWRSFFNQNIVKFLQKIDKPSDFPQATFIVFLLSDGNAHKYGFDSEEYEESIQLLDYFIKCLVEGLEDKKGNYIPGLKDLGIYEDIIWNICTDHAGRPIDPSKYVFIDTITDKRLKLNIIENENEEKEDSIDDLNGDLSSIDAFTVCASEQWHCWFGGPEGNQSEDFRKFYGTPYFQNYKRKAGENDSIDLVDYYVHKNYTQFVIIPHEDVSLPIPKQNSKERMKEPIPRSYTINIMSEKGSGKIMRRYQDGMIKYAYECKEEEDPLNYGNLGLNYGTFYSKQEWLKHTVDHQLPDVFHRLFGFFDCIHAPNFVITSAYDYRFVNVNQIMNKKEKAIQNIQSHGGIYQVESIVPVTIAGAGIKENYEIEYGRNVDILPTLLEVLGVDFDKKLVDGVVLTDVLEKH